MKLRVRFRQMLPRPPAAYQGFTIFGFRLAGSMLQTKPRRWSRLTFASGLAGFLSAWSGTLPLLFAEPGSTPNPEVEKVVEGCPVTRDLRSRGHLPRTGLGGGWAHFRERRIMRQGERPRRGNHNPSARLVQGADGKFFGTKQSGGANDPGRVFTADRSETGLVRETRRGSPGIVIASFWSPFLAANLKKSRRWSQPLLLQICRPIHQQDQRRVVVAVTVDHELLPVRRHVVRRRRRY